MRKVIFIIGLILIFTAPPLFTKSIRIAVIDFKAEGIPQGQARKISELIRGELINLRKFKVIERSQMNNIMKEQSFSQIGCADDNCAIKMGKLLSANKILIGTVMVIDNQIIISGRLVDTEKGIGEFSVNQRFEGDVLNTVKLFVTNLSRRIEGKDLLKKTTTLNKKKTTSHCIFASEEIKKGSEHKVILKKRFTKPERVYARCYFPKRIGVIEARNFWHEIWINGYMKMRTRFKRPPRAHWRQSQVWITEDEYKKQIHYLPRGTHRITIKFIHNVYLGKEKITVRLSNGRKTVKIKERWIPKILSAGKFTYIVP